MVHQLRSDDPDEHFQILKTARRHFSSGGPRRVKHTLPPLAFSALQVLLLLRLGAFACYHGQCDHHHVHACYLCHCILCSLASFAALRPALLSHLMSTCLLCVHMPDACTDKSAYCVSSCLLCTSGLALPPPCLPSAIRNNACTASSCLFCAPDLAD